MSSSASKVVLVTGCSTGGIGFYLRCQQFAEDGCIVYATSRKLPSMDGLPDGISKDTLDVTSEEDIRRVVDRIIKEKGRIDVVVNNAGGICAGAMLDIPLERVKDVFNTNTFASLSIAKAVVPHMASRKTGLIVNIGSIAGMTPTPWNGIYAASKAALHSITETLWMECKPFNINVMLVAPGSVRSNIANNNAKTLSVPEGSLYKDYTKQIIARMNVSQGKGSMPTALFAKGVVRRALQSHPPFWVSLGGMVGAAYVLTWLPRTWALTWMWRRFSKLQ